MPSYKFSESLSPFIIPSFLQNVYKDDLNWLKGIGCYVWDTPQILHAKKAYDLQSQVSSYCKDRLPVDQWNLWCFLWVTTRPVLCQAEKAAGSKATKAPCPIKPLLVTCCSVGPSQF